MIMCSVYYMNEFYFLYSLHYFYAVVSSKGMFEVTSLRWIFLRGICRLYIEYYDGTIQRFAVYLTCVSLAVNTGTACIVRLSVM